MQSQGLSSEAVWTAFDAVTTAAIRPIRHIFKIAWSRIATTTRSAFVIDQSTLDGSDIIQGQSNVITQPDYFNYFDETAHALRLEYDRGVEEPAGGISYAITDILLDNTSLRFTPNYNSTIGTALLPNRPLKMFMGFEVLGVDRTIPVMYGVTRDVLENKVGRTVDVTGYDYIYFINKHTLESTIYEDMRTDQIISDILLTIGFSESQFVLDEGLNVIPFAWFTKNDTAGERIRKLCEAEEGVFFQDEFGVLRFLNRRSVISSPYNASQWTFNPEDIMYWENDRSVQTINRAIVRATVRSVKSSQEIYRLSTTEQLSTGETILWATFDDPVSSISNPVATTDYLANTASDGTGSNATGSVTVSVDLLTTSAKITITNNYGSNVYVTFLRINGTPATVDSVIEEIFEDTSSQEKYGEQTYIVENDFIASQSFAFYLSRALVRRYKDPQSRLRITVPAVPQLQLRDRVSVKEPDLGTTTDYRVMRIQATMLSGDFYQVITLREITDLEATNPFTIDSSEIDGSDVVWS